MAKLVRKYFRTHNYSHITLNDQVWPLDSPSTLHPSPALLHAPILIRKTVNRLSGMLEEFLKCGLVGWNRGQEWLTSEVGRAGGGRLQRFLTLWAPLTYFNDGRRGRGGLTEVQIFHLKKSQLRNLSTQKIPTFFSIPKKIPQYFCIQGFWQGAAKNGELCGTMKVNCVAKKTNCVANCAAFNS